MEPVAPTKSKLKIIRDGRSTTTLIPKATIIVDTREQLPYSFEDFKNWVPKTELAGLKTGDYSVKGYEDKICLERKTLVDIVGSLMSGRERFLREMERMSKIPSRTLMLECSRAEIKTPYNFAQDVRAHPNGVIGSLDAISTKYNINVHYGCSRELCEEYAASWLSKAYSYIWLEENGHGRVFQEFDL